MNEVGPYQGQEAIKRLILINYAYQEPMVGNSEFLTQHLDVEFLSNFASLFHGINYKIEVLGNGNNVRVLIIEVKILII